MTAWPSADKATIDQVLQESIREVGFRKTLRKLRRGTLRETNIQSVTGGVVEIWNSGRVDAALETDGGPLVLQLGRRTDQHYDPQSVAHSRHRQHDNAVTLEDVIERSRMILALPSNWDDDGAVRVSEGAWTRATSFLRHQAIQAWRLHQTPFPIPNILPGPDGSVDLHWETLAFELLVNVPPHDCGLASFYGDDRRGGVIRGQLDPSQLNRGVLVWLAQE